MELKTIKIKDYKPHPKNYNRHPQDQIDELVKSLDLFGQFKNVVVWNKFILAGHGLIEAAKKRGDKTIDAVDMSKLDEEKALSLMVADNRLPDLAIIDEEQLANIFSEMLAPLDIPGVDEEFLNDIMVEGLQALDGSKKEKLKQEKKELKPYKKVHILISMDIDTVAEVSEILDKLQKIKGIEIEQGSN